MTAAVLPLARRGVLSDRDLARFIASLDMSDPRGCWTMQKVPSDSGYVWFNAPSLGGRGSVLAHRLAYRLWHGEIPEGHVVRHACDSNRRCCAPHHLSAGTQADNVRDQIAAGRLLTGDGLRKLSPAELVAVRAELLAGANLDEMAAKYGTCQRVMRNLRSGHRWKARLAAATPSLAEVA